MNNEGIVKLVMIRNFPTTNHWQEIINKYNLKIGWKTWYDAKSWFRLTTEGGGNVHPENNKYRINFPIYCFKIATNTVYPDE